MQDVTLNDLYFFDGSWRLRRRGEEVSSAYDKSVCLILESSNFQASYNVILAVVRLLYSTVGRKRYKDGYK